MNEENKEQELTEGAQPETAAEDAGQALTAPEDIPHGTPAFLEDDIDDELEPEEDEEDAPTPLLDQRVFGMSRYEFWGAAGGFGVGYIVCGLLSVAGIDAAQNSLVVAVLTAGAGYLLMRRRYQKLLAARDAEKHE